MHGAQFRTHHLRSTTVPLLLPYLRSPFASACLVAPHLLQSRIAPASQPVKTASMADSSCNSPGGFFCAIGRTRQQKSVAIRRPKRCSSLRFEASAICPDVLDKCEANEVDYVLGLTPASVLKRNVTDQSRPSARSEGPPLQSGSSPLRRIAVEMLIVFFGVVAVVVVDAVAMVRWRVQQCRVLSGSLPV